ncbi:hypothetical protein HHK36_023098 [Tetracentron sinense]|uniref:Uncharacterized protein n=1 Tax=Tetracentron sinense TaxID=13715 RepID=A0A835DA86_TETSI|nr:hypothetical protein HHK36_023098 [Tetracentron sinense]
MGGNNYRQRKSSSSFLSIFKIFKSKSSRDWDDTWDEANNVRRVGPSDDDKERWFNWSLRHSLVYLELCDLNQLP